MAQNTKIAFVSTDGKHILGDFGKTKYFSVHTINDNKIVNRELREVYADLLDNAVPVLAPRDSKYSIGKFALEVIDGSKVKHRKIAQSISDCEYVVARRLCANSLDSLNQLNFKTIVTKNKDFDKTIEEILDGTIVNYIEEVEES